MMMKDKVCLVTGGASGVGRSIAAGCAKAGATVAIVSRDLGRGETAAREMREASGNPRIEALEADLSSLASVRSLAVAFKAKYGALHLLSLNAAVMSLERRISPDGYESMFATNYLGHFALTGLLLDLLRSSAPSRVIAVSGQPSALVRARLDFEDLMLTRNFNPIKATARAALAKTLFAFELARRLQGSGVTSNAFHPGLVRSSLTKGLPWLLRLPASAAMLLLGTETATGLYLATSPDAQRHTGRLFVNCRPVDFRPPWDVAAEAARLWEASEELVARDPSAPPSPFRSR
jgi:NAD(P)-dependent dehydrogenase (short-subunit alcohol dehydrogenase family)